MNQLLNYKTVITGSSEGIGFGIAEAFARNSADVWLIGRDLTKLKQAEEKLQQYGVDVRTTAIDLYTDGASMQLADRICQQWDTVDVLVNNAGLSIFTPFSAVSSAEFESQLTLNVRVPYQLTQALLPQLQSAHGCIINISSYFAQRAIPVRPSTAYSLTKGAINSFTKSLACELGSERIRVNAIAPGATRTPLHARNTQKLSPEAQKTLDRYLEVSYPLHSMGEPEDIGNIAVYLASDAAKWITGAIFNVDGGLTTN
jgi:NAD(P)-dependent dehydrogenase (short-subunit alcohol dehydrogenase family)